MAVAVFAAAIIVSVASAAYAQPPEPPASPRLPDPAREATPAPNPWTFSSDAGLILLFVKPDKTADFETVLGRMKEALAKSELPARRAQAAAWRIFKAREVGAAAAVIYVAVMDPVVKDTDYSIGTIISEISPALYAKYIDAFANPAVNLLHLTPIDDAAR